MRQFLLRIMKGQDKGLIAGLIKIFLWPFSLLYGTGMLCHRGFYLFKGTYKAPRPVISVGNITVGGSGKTPLVIWLARHLQDKGYKSIVLIRGYMPKAAKISDEADMLNEQIPFIPVMTGADRISNIESSHPTMPVDVYIADDAFQHWPLARDLNIVAVDSGNPFGNGLLLPAGILREPLSALKRADVLVLTKTDPSNSNQELKARLKRVNPKALIVESFFQSAGAIDIFDTKPLPGNFLLDRAVIGFCAIGDPLSFASSLKNSGARSVKIFNFMDHHVYQAEDIKRLVRFCHEHKVDVLVTTHKDAVKLRTFGSLFEGIRFVYIPIQLEINKGSDEFIQKVISVCRY